MGDEAHRSIVFSPEGKTPQDLLLAFSRQLEAQGWLHDGSWVNPRVRGSIWHRKPADDLRLIGILVVTTLSDTDTEVLFRILHAGTEVTP